jgi:hypothetical protein
MRRRTLLLVAAFCLAVSPAQAIAILTDVVFLAKHADATAEITVVGSRLHTYRVRGEIYVCGQSYDIAIREVITGKIKGRRIAVGERIWSTKDEVVLGRMSGGVDLGATYFASFSGDPGYRHPEPGVSSFPESWKTPAYRACLKTLPKDQVVGMDRIYRGDGAKGMPATGRSYLRVPTSQSIDASAVFGSFTHGQYSDTPDMSEVPFHDMAVDYETFKRLLRDPSYLTAGRGSMVIP